MSVSKIHSDIWPAHPSTNFWRVENEKFCIDVYSCLSRTRVWNGARYRKSETSTWRADDWSSFWLRNFAYPSPNFYSGVKSPQFDSYLPLNALYTCSIKKQYLISKTNFGNADDSSVSSQNLVEFGLLCAKNWGDYRPLKFGPEKCVEPPSSRSSPEPKVYQRLGSRMSLQPRVRRFAYLSHNFTGVKKVRNLTVAP